MSKIDKRWIALAFFAFAIIMRFVPHPYNFAAVTALGLFAGCHLSGGVGLILAVGAMAISDFLGHQFGIGVVHFYDTKTMLAVYLAIGLAGGLGWLMRSSVTPSRVAASALAGSAIFFVTTNFASWLDPMMGYPQTLGGLVNCYIAAIPFALNTVLGDLFYSAVMFGGYALLTRPQPQRLPATQKA